MFMEIGFPPAQPGEYPAFDRTIDGSDISAQDFVSPCAESVLVYILGRSDVHCGIFVAFQKSQISTSVMVMTCITFRLSSCACFTCNLSGQRSHRLAYYDFLHSFHVFA